MGERDVDLAGVQGIVKDAAGRANEIGSTVSALLKERSRELEKQGGGTLADKREMDLIAAVRMLASEVSILGQELSAVVYVLDQMVRGDEGPLDVGPPLGG